MARISSYSADIRECRCLFFDRHVPLNNAIPASCACPPAQWYRFRPFLNNTSLASGMDRRTAARVVPTAVPTASTCSSDSAVVFTPVVPVDHVADDRQSGAASSARCREDGQEYVSQPRALCIPVCKGGRPVSVPV